ALHSIFKADCGGQCHDGADNGDAAEAGVIMNLNQEKSAVYSLLSSWKVKGENVLICEGIDLIVPNSAETSYLAALLVDGLVNDDTDTFAGIDGCIPSTTHKDRGDLTANAQKALKEWINAGAKND